MGKTKDARRVASNQAMAFCRSIRTSPRKLNLVAQSIRGLAAEKAVAELTFSKKRVAKIALGLLQSAIANAENNNGMNKENLYVAECYANKGPTMKRVRPRAQGRAYRIEKRMSHITVVLDER